MDNLFVATAPYICVWRRVLIILVIVSCALSLEETSPEIFLQPKNFNPHPYEVTERSERRNGPVVFPADLEQNYVVNRNNFVAIPNPLIKKHPVDNHPYTKVAKKRRGKVIGRLSNQNNQVSNRDYQALAKYATKVLSYPPEELGKDYTPSRKKERAKNYAFSYKVVDHLTGDDFSHSQTRNSKATNGEYRVKLPDGRVQIVSYTADKNGYKADVKYTENEGDAAQLGMPHQDAGVELQRIPVQDLYPVIETKPLEYGNDLQQQNHRLLRLQAIVPTQIPTHFNSNGDVTVSPSPVYLNAVDYGTPQNQPELKVQIYTTNARDYSIGSYIPTTVSPYLSKKVASYDRAHISPEITNNGDLGLFIPSSPPSFVVTDQRGHIIDNIKLVTTTLSPLIVGNHVTSTTPVPFVLNEARYRNLRSTVAPAV